MNVVGTCAETLTTIALPLVDRLKGDTEPKELEMG
jgi:hypothetical protein